MIRFRDENRLFYLTSALLFLWCRMNTTAGLKCCF